MLDGVVDIPLPGPPLWTDAQDRAGGTAVPFVAGPENRLVETAVNAVATGPSAWNNPLVFYGPSGVGKTHLARGIAAAWKAADRRRRVVCTTAVDFARELADAIETQAVEEFRTKHRTASLLVIEDLGQLAPRKPEKLSAQEELVCTLDAVVSAGGWVVATAPVWPTELPGILPALRSRLVAGLTIPLAPPGAEARRAILKRLAEAHGAALAEPAAALLAERVQGTVPQLAGALTHLIVQARTNQCSSIDPAAVQGYLARKKSARRPSLHEIALAVARHFALRLSDLRSPVRRRALVTARGVAIYLSRRWTDESLQAIGRYFGGRDHTTVLHGCRRTEALLAVDPVLGSAIDALHKELWKT